MAEIRIKEMDEHEIDTILAEDIDFEGYLTFKKPLMIKGKFKGEIKSTSALYIGEKAHVEAATEAAIVSSRGHHKGDIVAHSRVELYSTAQVEGDITTPDFVVESGCRFNGYCNMGGGANANGRPETRTQPQAAQPAPAAASAASPAPFASTAPAAAAPQPGAHPGQPGQPGQGPHAGPQSPAPGQRPGTPFSGPGGQQR